MHGYAVGLCSYSMYIYAFIYMWWNRGSLHSCSCILKITCGEITSAESLQALWASQTQKPMEVRLVSKSKSTHDKLRRYASSISNLNHATLFIYKLGPCQSVGGYLFARINIGIFYSVYLQVLPSQWVGSYPYLFVQNQYFCYILTC